MSYGLKVWDSSGDVILDTSDSFIFIKETLSGTVGSTTTTYTRADYDDANTEWAYLQIDSGDYPYTVDITDAATNNVIITNGNYSENGTQNFYILLYGVGVE